MQPNQKTRAVVLCKCGKRLRAHPDLAGRRVKCPFCKEEFFLWKVSPDPLAQVRSDSSAVPPVGGSGAPTVAIRASVAWKEWVHKLADFKRLTVADVIDQAVVKYARDEGFNETAPPR